MSPEFIFSPSAEWNVLNEAIPYKHIWMTMINNPLQRDELKMKSQNVYKMNNVYLTKLARFAIKTKYFGMKLGWYVLDGPLSVSGQYIGC